MYFSSFHDTIIENNLSKSEPARTPGRIKPKDVPQAHKGGGISIIHLFSLNHQASYPYTPSIGSPRSVGSNVPAAQAEAKRGGNVSSASPDYDTYECQTCKNRKYQDGSNDPGVSFKTPTRISPERAPYAIRAHEGEHVAHARARAAKEDEEIVSQSVTYHTDICPECGRVYMSGGTTRTVFRSQSKPFTEDTVKKGLYLDLTA